MLITALQYLSIILFLWKYNIITVAFHVGIAVIIVHKINENYNVMRFVMQFVQERMPTSKNDLAVRGPSLADRSKGELNVVLESFKQHFRTLRSEGDHIV